MKYLLDTCLLSEFLKKTPSQDVIRWVGQQPESSLCVSVLTFGEVHKGIARLAASKRKTELRLWLQNVITRYGGRVLPVSFETAEIWGDLMAVCESRGRVLPVVDSLIAATALEHDLTIVTRNEDDFTPTGVKVLNLWQ